MKDLEGMGTVEFLKLLAVRMVDDLNVAQDDPYLLRLVNLARIIEAEGMDATPVGAPDGEHPTELRDEIIKIIRRAYIGSNPSALKAEKTANEILEALVKHYQEAEITASGGVQ